MKLALYCSGGRRSAADDLATVRHMLAAMDRDAVDGMPRAGGAVSVHGGALGWLHTSDAGGATPLARQSADGDVLLVAGAPICARVPWDRGLEDTLARALTADPDDAEDLLTGLDGGFAAVRWHAASRELLVVTDFMGFQPLHVARAAPGGPLVIATELKALVASGATAAEPDPATWGAFVGFGHALGDQTLLAGARRVPAGSALHFTPAAGAPAAAARERRYWHWPAPGPVRSLAEVDVGALVGALGDSVRAYHGAYRRDGVVLLSGGFDSRLVLSLVRDAGIPARALIVRYTDELHDADGRLAERVARRLGVPHEVHAPPADFFAGDGYRRYLWSTELGSPSLLLFMSRVAAALRPEFGAVWEGIAPNAMQRLNRNPGHGGFAEFLARACPPRRGAVWSAFASVFRREWADECYAAHHAALAAERARYRDDEFGVFEFAVRSRARHRLAQNPFAAFAPTALPFTPGVTRSFYDQTYSLSGHILGKSDVRLRIFREHFPEAGAEPFNSGGTLIPGVGQGSLESRLLLHLAPRARGHPLARRALGRLLGHRGPTVIAREAAPQAVLGMPLVEAVADDPRVNADAVRALLTPAGAGAAERALAERRAADGWAYSHLFHWAAARRIFGGV